MWYLIKDLKEVKELPMLTFVGRVFQAAAGAKPHSVPQFQEPQTGEGMRDRE